MLQTTIAYFMRGGPCMWPFYGCGLYRGRADSLLSEGDFSRGLCLTVLSADECGEKEGSPRYGGRCARGCGFSGLPDHR